MQTLLEGASENVDFTRGGKFSDEEAEFYNEAIEEFENIYGDNREISVYSAPGRTEICGNHTDHNCGLIVAAAISEDTICVVSKTVTTT